MNYKKIHDNIIAKAKNRILNEYYEKHHIVPKCMGGTDDSENIVKLTLREHFLVHWLLSRMYSDSNKISYAFFMMSNRYNKNNLRMSSIAYKEARERYYEARKNFKHTKESNLKNSIATKKRLAEKNIWIGKKHSEESKRKQSESAKNRKIDPEKEKIRREGISTKMKGIEKSDKAKENISNAKKGNKNPMFGKKWKLIDGERVFY